MGHGAWGMGHGAWGIGEPVRCGGSLRCSTWRHWAWGMGHGAWGIGYWALVILPTLPTLPDAPWRVSTLLSTLLTLPYPRSPTPDPRSPIPYTPTPPPLDGYQRRDDQSPGRLSHNLWLLRVT